MNEKENELAAKLGITSEDRGLFIHIKDTLTTILRMQ